MVIDTECCRLCSNRRNWNYLFRLSGSPPTVTMLQSIFDDVRRMNKRQVNFFRTTIIVVSRDLEIAYGDYMSVFSDFQFLYQVLSFGMIVSSALMIWKGLMVVTGSESPIVVVLRYRDRFKSNLASLSMYLN